MNVKDKQKALQEFLQGIDNTISLEFKMSKRLAVSEYTKDTNEIK